jgi:hypothetical protein
VTARDDADRLIGTWFGESAAAGTPDYADDILAAVAGVSQHRRPSWLRAPWAPGPAEAPVMRGRYALAAVALLVVAVALAALAAGARPKPPPFTLQSVIPLVSKGNTIFATADARGIWATGNGIAQHVDAVTGEVTTVPVPQITPYFTGVIMGDGSLWAADYNGNRVLRLDPATGAVIDTVEIQRPMGFTWRDGPWVGGGQGRGLSHIDPSTNRVDRSFPTATGAALGDHSLWYTESDRVSGTAVEIDLATGKELSRVPIPRTTAGGIVLDGEGNAYAWRSGSEHSELVVIDGSTHAVSATHVLLHDLIGGVVRIGDSIWGVVGPGADGRPRLIEIGPNGPTGREEALPPEVDPDSAVVAFGSIWIPSESDSTFYRFPTDALTR